MSPVAPVDSVVRFDHERILAELADFFERETGQAVSDPLHMPVELRVPDRRAAAPQSSKIRAA